MDNTSAIARLANRVLMVAKQEADNSEDPSFVAKVNAASDQVQVGECNAILQQHYQKGYSMMCITCSNTMNTMYLVQLRAFGN